MGTTNSDEHDAEHGVRSGPGQPLAPEQRDKPGASSYQQDTPEDKGGDVSGRAGPVETNMTDRSSCQPGPVVSALGMVGERSGG